MRLPAAPTSPSATFTLSNPPFDPGKAGNYVNAIDGRGKTAGFLDTVDDQGKPDLNSKYPN